MSSADMNALRGRTTRARAARGFTLLELAVAMAMTGILTVAVLSTFSMISRYRVRVQLMSAVDDTAKLLTSYVVTELRRAGGATLRPWQAVAVKECDSPSGSDFRCQYGDSLTLAYFDEEAATTSCDVVNFTVANAPTESYGTIAIGKVAADADGDGTIATGEQVCCNRIRTIAGADTVVADAEMQHHHLILVRGNTHVGLTYGTPTGAECTWNWFRSKQISYVVSGDGAGAVTKPSVVWDTGTSVFALPVQVASLFVGCSLANGGTTVTPCTTLERGLYLFSDSNAGTSAATTTIAYTTGDTYELLGAGVVDMRIRIGADWDLDGQVEEPNFGTATDEWQTNQAILQSATYTANIDRMRLVQVSLTAGGAVHDPTFRNFAKAYMSPVAPFSQYGAYFATGYSRAAMMSLASFR